MSSQLTMVVMMRTGRMIYNSLPVITGVLKLFRPFLLVPAAQRQYRGLPSFCNYQGPFDGLFYPECEKKDKDCERRQRNKCGKVLRPLSPIPPKFITNTTWTQAPI